MKGVAIILAVLYGLVLLILAACTEKAGKTLLFSCGSGLAALFIIHFTAQYSGVALPLNWYTLGGSAALGVPGVITLLLLQVIIT